MKSSTGNFPNQDQLSFTASPFEITNYESGNLELSDKSPAYLKATDGTNAGAQGDILHP